MAILEKKFYDPGNGDFVGVTVRGAFTPSAVTAGVYYDPVLDVNNPNELGLMIMEGHIWVKAGTFTAGGGTVSVGFAVKPRDTFTTVAHFLLATCSSAIAAAAEGNAPIPDTIAGGTGLLAKLAGLAAAGTAGDLGKGYILSLGMPFMVPNVVAAINTGVTSAPLIDWLVTMRCIKTKRI